MQKKNCTEVINYILENNIAPDSVFYSKLSDGNYSVLVQHIQNESEVEHIREDVLEHFKDSGIIIKSSILKPSMYGEKVFTVKFIVKFYDVTTDSSLPTGSNINQNTNSESPSRKRVSNIFDHLNTSEIVSQFVNEHKASEFTWNPPDYITVAGIKFHITNQRDTDMVRKPNGTSAMKYSTHYESTEKDSKGRYPIFTVVVVQRSTWGFGNNHSATYAYNTWEMEQKLKSFINERIEDNNTEFNESIASDIDTLEPIGTLIYQMKNNLVELSSIYANADDTSSRIKWTGTMKNKYESAYEEGLVALQRLRSCVEYMTEFEAESESNY